MSYSLVVLVNWYGYLLYEKIPYQGWLPWYGIDFTILIFLCSVLSYLDLSCLISLSRSFFFLLLVGIIKFLGLVFTQEACQLFPDSTFVKWLGKFLHFLLGWFL